MSVRSVYHLGDRLEMMKRIKEKSVDMIITSPPYNLNKRYTNNEDFLPYNEYLTFLFDTWKAGYRVLKDGGRIAINVPSITYNGEYKPLYSDVIKQMEGLNFIMRGEIIWHKHQISKRTAWGSWRSPSNPSLVQPYEFVLVFSKSTKKHEGDKENIDITKEEFINNSNALWDIKPETTLHKHHPAPFPEELVYRLLKFYTYRGDLVLDMFGGSGTTAFVSRRLKRHFIYIDNSEEYFNFAKRRIEKIVMPLTESF